MSKPSKQATLSPIINLISLQKPRGSRFYSFSSFLTIIPTKLVHSHGCKIKTYAYFIHYRWFSVSFVLFCIHLFSFKLKQRGHFQSSRFETVSHLQVSRTLFSDVNHCSKLLSVIFSLLPFLKLQLALHAFFYTHAILLPSGGTSISSSNHLSNSSWLFCTKPSFANKIFYQNLLLVNIS